MTLGKRIFNLLRRTKRKLFKPRVMRRLESEGTANPRLRVSLPGNEASFPVVYRINSLNQFSETENALKALLYDHFYDLINDKKVLVKFNLNTANPYPASVCPEMLCALVDILLALGAKEVNAGDCCTVRLLPTKKQVRKAGLEKVLQGRANVICFDDTSWMTVPVPGQYLKKVTVPRPALEAETIIALANLKTHVNAVYTGALKLLVGFMHPLERYPLHQNSLQEKIAEISLAIQPDLFVLDARTAMITGGPDHGKTIKGEVVLVGDNPLAVDLEAYKLLYNLKKQNDCLDGFKEDPFSIIQFRHARDIGVGGNPWQGYKTIEWLK